MMIIIIKRNNFILWELTYKMYLHTYTPLVVISCGLCEHQHCNIFAVIDTNTSLFLCVTETYLGVSNQTPASYFLKITFLQNVVNGL